MEVKNQDGVYQEATINKLTDASIYTVGKSITISVLSLLTQRPFLQVAGEKICFCTMNIPKGFRSLYFPFPKHYILKCCESHLQSISQKKDMKNCCDSLSGTVTVVCVTRLHIYHNVM